MPGGIRLRCYPHTASASAVIYYQLPEFWEMHFLLDTLEAGDCLVDVGANVGVYVLLACSVPGVEVWAFEPSTRAYEMACENVRINGLGERVHLSPRAVGSRAANGRLTVGLDCGNHLVSSPTGCLPTSAEPVEVVALDDVIPEEIAARVTLLKVDVEGTEVDVLEGARRLLTDKTPAVLVEKNRPKELLRYFEPLGYTACVYDPSEKRLVSIDLLSSTESNVLFVRDWAVHL